MSGGLGAHRRFGGLTGHLLALKVLARDSLHVEDRPQDLGDIRELLRVADGVEITRARPSLVDLHQSEASLARSAKQIGPSQSSAPVPGRLRSSVVRELVGNSPDLYRILLDRTSNSALRVAPLAGTPPDEEWCRLARLALDAGVDPGHVAAESLFPLGPYTPGVEHWVRWSDAFRLLVEDQDPGFRTVAQLGLDLAEERVQEEKARERQLSLMGLR